MELYEVTVDYVEYLRKFEPKKILSVADGKDKRKFLGVIIQKSGFNYVIPLSSPKYKKDYEIEDYDGEHLPNDFSFGKYEDRIHLLKKQLFRLCICMRKLVKVQIFLVSCNVII